MIYRYHPHAQRELDDATDYYDIIDLELGDDFLEEIDGCISRILMFPLEEEQVFILAVMHQSREPNYWGGPIVKKQDIKGKKKQHTAGYARKPSQPDEFSEWEPEQIWPEYEEGQPEAAISQTAVTG